MMMIDKSVPPHPMVNIFHSLTIPLPVPLLISIQTGGSATIATDAVSRQGKGQLEWWLSSGSSLIIPGLSCIYQRGKH